MSCHFYSIGISRSGYKKAISVMGFGEFDHYRIISNGSNRNLENGCATRLSSNVLEEW